MAPPMLLEPRFIDGRLVYVADDTRTLGLTGGSTPYVSISQELLARVGLYADGAVQSVDVEQEIRLDQEGDELVVENRIDLSAIEGVEEFDAPEPAAPSAD